MKVSIGLNVGIAALLIGSVSVAEAKDMPGIKESQKFSSYHEVGYDQPLRPQFHFTSLKGWINDPNGLVYSDGEWHMCFQHLPPEMPRGRNRGLKHWANAVSTDLFHWEQLPHAIVPYPKVDGGEGVHQIYSGSAVVDVHNALGKQEGDVKTLFALFSAVNFEKGFFQAGAYSTDKGRTWTKINDGKPIIPFQEGMELGQRDPRIFYYAPEKCYVTIMMVGGPQKAVRLWKSTDLLNWEVLFDIPDKKAECIDMYEVPLDGDPNNKKWVISNAHTGYEVGEFDLKSWKPEIGEKTFKYDYGDACYAAQVFSQGPDDRVVHIGWMRTKNTAFKDANLPFFHQLSVPAEITLKTTPEGIRMYRNPVKEIEGLYVKTDSFKNITVKEVNEKLKPLSLDLVDMTLTFAPKENLTLNLRGTPIVYNFEKQQFEFRNLQWEKVRQAEMDRQDIKGKANGGRTVSAPIVDGKVTVRILVDRASMEFFVNNGHTVATFFFVPDPKERSISIEADDEKQIESIVVNELKSAWKK